MVSGSKSLQKFRLKNRKVCDSDKRRGRNCDIISDTGASSLFLILFKDTPSQPIPGIGLVLWSSKYLNSPFTLLILLIDTTHQRFPAASTLTMGKIDQKQTKKRSCKATCKSKHKATDGDSEHKKQPSLDATKFEATNDDGNRHSHWRDQFRQLCDFKVQFGHCLVPQKYADNPMLGRWVSTQRTAARLYPDGTPNRTPSERIRALDGIGYSSTRWYWFRMGDKLERKAQFGHCNVPQ